MKKSLVLLPLAFLGTAAMAAPVQMTSLAFSDGGGFKHNNFHSADINKGTDGTKLGWFTLGAGGGFYDNVTGDFQMNIDIFTDSSLTTASGTAFASGNLDPLEFNGFDGGVIGSIFWDFDAAAEANGLVDTTTTFYDVNYGASSALNNDYFPNSAFNNHMTLWGADGDLDPLTGMYEGNGVAPTMGVDFVATFVPVPAAVWLFGSGLLALVGFSRRQQRQ